MFGLAALAVACTTTSNQELGDCQDPSAAGTSPARFLVAAGDAALENGRLDEARRQYEKAATLARRTSDAAEEILALNQLGVLSERQGALEDAEDHYRSALELQQVADDGTAEPLLRANLASVELRRGKLADAEREAKTAIRLVKPLEEPATAAAAHRQLGRVLLAQSRDDEAIGALSTAATLFSRAAFRKDEAGTRLELGRALLRHGDVRHAVPELSRACEAFSEGGAKARPPAEVPDALHDLALCFDALAEPQNALTFRQRAIETARRRDDVDQRRRLLDDGVEAASKLKRDDLAASWREERDRLPTKQ